MKLQELQDWVEETIKENSAEDAAYKIIMRCRQYFKLSQND